MGAYLNKPVTEKVTEEGGNARLHFGASSMQGWRVNQEDAHNCIADFTNNCALFAVYDGHGGSEVAQYTALNFPKFLLDKDTLKKDKNGLVKALEEAFIDFDDHIRSADVLHELKAMANKENGVESDEEDEDGEEDRKELIEEQKLPLEALLKKYGCMLVKSGLNGSIVNALMEGTNGKTDGDSEAKEKKKRPHSPEGEHTKRHKVSNGPPKKMRRADAVAEDDEDAAAPAGTADGGDSHLTHECVTSLEKRGMLREEAKADDEPGPASSGISAPTTTADAKSDNNPGASSASGAAGHPDLSSDSDSGDDDYVGGEESEEEEDESEQEEEEGDEEADVEEGDEKEEDEVSEEDSSDDGELNAAALTAGPGVETPGEDSGTTACVALVFEDRVVVANVGDSRAVLSRAGTAVDLSVDHKPEDEEEKRRIEKAGGEISDDGRVNGGLNLSRALGDHCYKKTASLPLAEQMISALPDVKEETLCPEDQFLIVACDGIWNSLSSQACVDFVKERLERAVPIPQICEQLCTACLADSTDGDGTGCDNMTVIIVDLKNPHKIDSP